MAVMFQVPEQVFMATYNYLQTRPYSEVSQLIAAVNTVVQRIVVPDPPGNIDAATKANTDAAGPQV